MSTTHMFALPVTLTALLAAQCLAPLKPCVSLRASPPLAGSIPLNGGTSDYGIRQHFMESAPQCSRTYVFGVNECEARFIVRVRNVWIV